MRLKLNSLRLRLLALAAMAVTAAMILSAVGLVTLFGRHVERRIGQELDTHILQLAGNLLFDASGALKLESEPTDPRFEKVYGGLYWQVFDESKNLRIRSVSLWDADLSLPVDRLLPGETHRHIANGPDGAQTIVHERRVILSNGKEDRPVTLSVAINMAELAALKTGFAFDLVPAVALLGLLLLAGLWWQVSEGLKPVTSIGDGIRAIRSGDSKRLSGDVPSEIQPLVGEVNELLDAQEASLTRARDRAADLAHGLKTPLTALASDIMRLRKAGQHEVADDIGEIAKRMRDIVERELARSRIRNSRVRYKPIPVATAANAVIRTLVRTPQGEGKTFEVAAKPELAVVIDPDDLNDLIGNLLENASRAAKSRIQIAAFSNGHGVRIEVSDDGPGVPEDQMESLSERGKRLDQSAGSAGLGLSLVADILEAYGYSMTFSKSALGGLGVSFTLPAGG